MIERPPSLAYEPWCPPKWSSDRTLEIPSADPATVAAALGLVFDCAVGVSMEGGELEVRWPVAVAGALAVVLFDAERRPVDAFILPRGMIEELAVRDGQEVVYPLTARRRHHVAVLEALVRQEVADHRAPR